jgi:hypothetical protein
MSLWIPGCCLTLFFLYCSKRSDGRRKNPLSRKSLYPALLLCQSCKQSSITLKWDKIWFFNYLHFRLNHECLKELWIWQTSSVLFWWVDHFANRYEIYMCYYTHMRSIRVYCYSSGSYYYYYYSSNRYIIIIKATVPKV